MILKLWFSDKNILKLNVDYKLIKKIRYINSPFFLIVIKDIQKVFFYLKI